MRRPLPSAVYIPQPDLECVPARVTVGLVFEAVIKKGYVRKLNGSTSDSSSALHSISHQHCFPTRRSLPS